jgi:hypothetical protein
MRKVAIIFNKSWELEPALVGMCAAEFCPPSLPFPATLHGLLSRQTTTNEPRAIFSFHEKGDPSLQVLLEVKAWCIQDMMTKSVSSSNSQEKFRVLPPVLASYAPDLVIAGGTAGFVSDTTIAGCVVVGGRFFLHDGLPGNYSTHLTLPGMETLLPLNVNPAVINTIINPPFKQTVEPKLARPPINPAARLTLLSSQYYTAISSINITDYGMYAWVDSQAVAAFRKVETSLPVGSIETTHALIRSSTDAPCMFISGIPNLEGHIDMEATNGQNYLAAFNIGVVLGYLIVGINGLLVATPNFSFKTP